MKVSKSRCSLLHQDVQVAVSTSNVAQMTDALTAHSSNIEECADERDLAISAPKSTITLFTPQFAQSNTHPQVTEQILTTP